MSVRGYIQTLLNALPFGTRQPVQQAFDALYTERSGVTAGTYGSSTAIPVLTIDGRGRVTAASNSTFSAGAASVTTTRVLTVVIDGGSSVVTTGIKAFVQVPFAATITSWTVLSVDGTGPATSGSIVIDIWKGTYANYPPTVADTITASAKPTLSSATKNTSTTLTGWTTSVAAGDVFGIYVDSAATVTKVVLELTLSVTS